MNRRKEPVCLGDLITLEPDHDIRGLLNDNEFFFYLFLSKLLHLNSPPTPVFPSSFLVWYASSSFMLVALDLVPFHSPC